MKKLNLGSGYVDTEGWIHVDKVKYHDHQVVADILGGLPFEDSSFDFILANHTLQMFHYDELPMVLKEVRRILKPGGTFRILTPSLTKAIDAYQNLDFDYFPISDDLEPTIPGKFARYLFWHGDTRCAFTRVSLEYLLRHNGFFGIHDSQFGSCELDSREKESLILECTK